MNLLEQASNGSLENVMALLDAGVDINQADSNRRTALHHAINLGHSAMSRLLLQRGADPHAPDFRGETPLHRAAWVGLKEIAAELVALGAQQTQNQFGITPLHLACANDRCNVATYFLDIGVPVDPLSYKNNTPLHRAAAKGAVRIVRLLLERGADWRFKNSDGKTPLDVASNEDVARLLRSHARQHPSGPARRQPPPCALAPSPDLVLGAPSVSKLEPGQVAWTCFGLGVVHKVREDDDMVELQFGFGKAFFHYKHIRTKVVLDIKTLKGKRESLRIKACTGDDLSVVKQKIQEMKSLSCDMQHLIWAPTAKEMAGKGSIGHILSDMGILRWDTPIKLALVVRGS
eukprot:GILK01002295.1.p1 GENE.GILK01002295.1~~GILK01002295.1.p1  ORF type:complete len:346 (-),score=46.00 GILK01002295.1:191-1228(-)